MIYILTNLHPEISYEAGFGHRQLKVTKKKEKMQSMQAKEVYFYLYLIQLWDHFLILLLVINKLIPNLGVYSQATILSLKELYNKSQQLQELS